MRIFRDPLKNEIKYVIHTKARADSLTPANKDFSILVGKLGITSEIIANVDPFDSKKYQLALSKGIAHAKGTKLPGEDGNVFLFAHSSADLLTAERYNSVFYLIHHLDKGDIIDIWYEGQQYKYEVSSKEFVSPGSTSALTRIMPSETLTLMTCWPPGTTLSRLIITAIALD
jgi:sortase A